MSNNDTWELSHNRYVYATITASSADEAIRRACDDVDPEDYDNEETIWVDVRARNVATGEVADDTVMVEAPEPRCADGHKHYWRDMPDVRGHGAGVIMRAVCKHCGKVRITDTWAQRPDTGEQGFTTVEYGDE